MSLRARLSAKHLTVHLWNLDTLELRNICALLLGEGATLPAGGFRAFGSWNCLTLFLLHSFTLPLLDVIALLLRSISALLRVTNFLTDLSGNRVAFSSINCLTLAARHIPAFLLWNLGALSVTDNTALLRRDVLTDLFLDSVTLLLIDNLALCFSIGSALLFVNRAAFVFERSATLLAYFGRAFFFMDSLGDSSWNIDTFQLRDIVALLILHGATLFPGVLSSLALLPGLGSTLPSGNSLLHSCLGDLTLSLLDISTNCVGNLATLLPGDRFIRSLRDLVTNFFGYLSTHWFGRRSCSLDRRRVELKRQRYT